MKKVKHSAGRLLMMVFLSGVISLAIMQSALKTVHAPCSNFADAATIDAVSTQQQSQSSIDTNILCNRDQQQISWVTWLFERPESVQFHFIDLLELLNRT